MLTVLGLLTGAWPSGAGWGRLLATLVPMALIGGCFGVSAGLLLRRSIPAFLMALVATFGGWILGCAFGLRGSFGRGYEVVSAAVPNSWAVELLFPVWFDRQVGDPRVAATVLTAMVAILLVGVWLLWLRRMRGSS
jgi:hypothetical protein